MQRFFAAGKAVHAILQQVGAQPTVPTVRPIVLPSSHAREHQIPQKPFSKSKAGAPKNCAQVKSQLPPRRQTVACEAVRIVPPQTQAVVSRV